MKKKKKKRTHPKYDHTPLPSKKNLPSNSIGNLIRISKKKKKQRERIGSGMISVCLSADLQVDQIPAGHPSAQNPSYEIPTSRPKNIQYSPRN